MRRKGQIAVVFLVLMALILLLAVMTMNLGEVARLRTSTANAADAGALAAASWVASSENRMAQAAKSLWLSQFMVQAILAIPACPAGCWYPVALYALMVITHQLMMMTVNEDAHAAWDRAHAAALFTAILNATIDDPTDKVRNEIKALSDQFEATQTVPSTVKFEWVRKGAHAFPEPSSLEISVNFTNDMPKLELNGWGPSSWCWGPCMYFWTWHCCWGPVYGWFGGTFSTTPAMWVEFMLKAVKATFTKWTTPLPGACNTCFPIPLPLGAIGLVTPSDIANEQGEVSVTVAQHRQRGSNLRFWTMRYPDQIVSQATARYGGASVDFWPKPDAKAELVSVQ